MFTPFGLLRETSWRGLRKCEHSYTHGIEPDCVLYLVLVHGELHEVYQTPRYFEPHVPYDLALIYSNYTADESEGEHPFGTLRYAVALNKMKS